MESARGGDILVPKAVTASSHYSLVNWPDYLINGAGLTGTGLSATHTNGLGQSDMWLTANGTVSTNWVQFDLGGERDVLNTLIWQYNQTLAADNTARGAKTYTIQVAGADQVFSDFAVSNTLSQAGGTSAEPVQVVPLVASNVRYVKFNVHANFITSGSGYVGLSEVRFDVEPPDTSGILITPTAVNASSYYGAPSDVRYKPDYLINGNGLTGTGLTATHTNGNASVNWQSAASTVPTDQWVEFDLGREFLLTAAVVWNGNHSTTLNTRDVKHFTIETAGNSKSYTRYAQRYLAKSAGNPGEPAQIVRLDADNVRWVKFKIDQTWTDPSYVCLAEVRFIYQPKGTLISVR